MLPSQRDAFDIPREVCYLNAASWSPLPRKVQEAGHEGVDRKAKPWEMDPGLARAQHERTRKAAAAHPIEATGAQLRAMMPWIAKNKLVDQAKN